MKADSGAFAGRTTLRMATALTGVAACAAAVTPAGVHPVLVRSGSRRSVRRGLPCYAGPWGESTSTAAYPGLRWSSCHRRWPAVRRTNST